MIVHLKLQDDSEEYVDVVRMGVHDYVEDAFLLDLPEAIDSWYIKETCRAFDYNADCSKTLGLFYNCQDLFVGCRSRGSWRAEIWRIVFYTCNAMVEKQWIWLIKLLFRAQLDIVKIWTWQVLEVVWAHTHLRTKLLLESNLGTTSCPEISEEECFRLSPHAVTVWFWSILPQNLEISHKVLECWRTESSFASV